MNLFMCPCNRAQHKAKGKHKVWLIAMMLEHLQCESLQRKQSSCSYPGEQKVLEIVHHVLQILTGINFLVFCFISHISVLSKHYPVIHEPQRAEWLTKHTVPQLCQILVSNPAFFICENKLNH